MAFANAQNTDASHSTFNDVHANQINIYRPGVFDGTSQKEQDALVNALPRVPQARYDAINGVTGCLNDTRTALLREINTWASNVNLNEPRIYLLSGLAGTGKSTIALTVSENLRKQASLAATFFFSRDNFDRSQSTKLFSSLAHQLCLFNPTFRGFIADALQSDPDLASTSIQTQLKELIIKPLQRVTEPHPPAIIVMDALDECQPPSDASDILALLASEICKVPFPLKFLITSRPEHYILARIENHMMRHLSRTVFLHEIEASVVQADIERYLLHSFTHIGEMLVGHSQWWTEEELKILAKKSAGLFIFASTAVKFIDDNYFHNPRHQLNILLDMKSAVGKSPYQDLDRLYRRVLSGALLDDDMGELSGRFRMIVGAIVLLYDRLTSGPLENLLKVERGSVRATLGLLHSVIVVPRADDQHIRIIHPSFADFITQLDRCTDKRFFIEPKIHHSHLALRCLERMISLLRRDICQINDASKMNSEVKDLRSRLDIAVPPDLQYACVHWAMHLSRADTTAPDTLGCLNFFCFNHLLHWLEVLSLMGCLNVARTSLKHAQQWLTEASGDPREISELLADTDQFIIEFLEPISAAALHVYYSALPFTPYDTLLFKTFRHELGSSVNVLRGRKKVWNRSVRVIESRCGNVHTVAFSRDGTCVASGSGDGTVRLWDSITGAPIMVLEGHSDAVPSVVFSPDGEKIVSGSRDRTVRLWDSATGIAIALLHGHVLGVNSVAFSPDGLLVVSGSDDRVARIWDATTGACVTRLIGHEWGGGFSMPDIGNPVRIWDTIAGTLVATLVGHSCPVWSVAYSPCGKTIISVDYGHVWLWDSSTCALLSTFVTCPFKVRFCTSVAFSPDGKFLITGHFDGSMLFRELATGTPIVTFEPESGIGSSEIMSVAFSPDGAYVASGSTVVTLRLWDSTVHKGVIACEDSDHSLCINCVAFSADGAHIVTGSNDTTVRLWDSISGAPLAIFEGHLRSVRSLTFSPDGTITASGSDNSQVCLWDSRSYTPHATRVLTGYTGLGPISALAFSSDGTRLASVSSIIIVWDVASGASITTVSFLPFIESNTYTLAVSEFSPDNVYIAYGGVGGLHIWDSTTGVQTTSLHESFSLSLVTSLAYSPGGSHIVSGHNEGSVRIWDSTTGECLDVLRSHSSEVHSVVFSSDSSCITSRDRDGVLHCREWATGARKATPSPKYTLIGQWVEHVDGLQCRKVCWLPLSARQGCGFFRTVVDYADRLALGNSQGRLTILDFSNCK